MDRASHPEIIKRLKRAFGQLASVIVTIEEGGSCVDLVQQLYAVENAVATAKRDLIHDLVEQRLANGAGESEVASMPAPNESGNSPSTSRRDI